MRLIDADSVIALHDIFLHVGSITYGKERWFDQGDGTWYDRKYCDCVPLDEAVERLIETVREIEEAPTVDAVPVERDIPKAPTDKELEEDGYGAWGSLYGRCPNCRESVYEEQNYCEKCGQRLDWAERKDE